MKVVVWGEIRAAYRAAERRAEAGLTLPIGGELLPEDSRLRSGHPHHYMLGYTAKDADAFQGLHAENVLVIVTEAQGVEPAIWPGIESLLSAKNAKLLLIGNAIYEPESEFYASFSSKASQFMNFTLDSEKSSHCSPQYVQDMRETFGEDSPMFQARVKGTFPTNVTDTLIPLGWMEKAHARWKAGGPSGAEVVIGADIARFGTDHTVFYSGDATGRFWLSHDKQGQDLMETAGELKRRINGGVNARRVRVDDTGLGGGVTDRLREQGARVVALNFGSKATDEEKFANARSEIFWALRERFRTNDISIDPADVKLVRDLSVLRSKMTSKGQIKLEEKAEAKRRLGYSPDRADALACAALPEATSLDLERGAIPGRGLLEYMAERSKLLKQPDSMKEAATRPMSEVAGAAQLIGGGSNVHP